ncbi:MAG: hypothetical protein H7122_03060 [Chitinophagaceae bacterium]|nr:hypothetical protein [Chitinophagaceae bacterium]
MFEHKKQPLLPVKAFYKRSLWYLFISFVILFTCLLIGIAGYHFIADAKWLDAFHNASMILSGMGPVIDIEKPEGKWFSSLYALFSGVVFITNIGVILAPAAHRIFHILHLEEN